MAAVAVLVLLGWGLIALVVSQLVALYEKAAEEGSDPADLKAIKRLARCFIVLLLLVIAMGVLALWVLRHVHYFPE